MRPMRRAYEMTLMNHSFAVLVSVAAAGVIAVAGDLAVNDLVQTAEPVPSTRDVAAMASRFAPSDIRADVTSLPDNERRALGKLVEAARLMDSLFLRQVWAGNDAMLQELSHDALSRSRTASAAAVADANARLHYFLINKGPWSRLDHNRVFIQGAPAKPEGANFYPADASKADVQRWLDSLAGEEKARATGFFTTIRKAPSGGFVAVPYSVEYQGELARAASLLREAAALTSQPTLKHFLTTRADAFLSDDYYASDVAWMELDASIEPTIGPYEVYEDEWFNFKAAFEAFITIRDEAESKKLQSFSAHLQELENALPIDPKYRNAKLGALSPIRVVNVVFSAGDGNRGVQTAAYNLPNDERVVKAKGTKRAMLKTMQDAKFNRVLVPISKVALQPADQKNVSFDAFFTHILMHELMHGLGPHEIKVDGRKTTVRAALQDTYSAIEEAKADISGLFALQYLVDKGVIDKSLERTMYTSFLASCFRSIRFGLKEAHGKGIALQLTTLLDAGAFQVAKNGTFSVDATRIADAVTSLTREIMTLEAEGNYAKTKDLLERLGVVRPPVQKVLDRLTNVPVDIEPTFTSAVVQ